MSTKYHLNKEDMKRLGSSFGKYVGSAAAVAAVAWGVRHYSEIDFGSVGVFALPLIGALLGWLGDVTHKWASDSEKEDDE